MRVAVVVVAVMLTPMPAGCTATGLGPDWRASCQATLDASVRGNTGTFPDAETAARSLHEGGGELEVLEGSATYAAFGVLTASGLEKVIEVHRDRDGNWSVGSFQECRAR